MKYAIDHFKSVSTGKAFHEISSWAEGDMEEDWRGSVTSCITGEPLLAIYYPSDLGSSSFAERVNKRLQRDEYRDVVSIEWGTDENGFRVTTKYSDVFDPNGYAVKTGTSTIEEYEAAGGKYAVEGKSIR